MFKTLKRIINWVGPYKKRLYLGTLCAFLSTWFTAMPIITAAWALGEIISSIRNDIILDFSIVWKSFLAISASVLFRYLFSYSRARLQDSIGTERAAEERIRIGDMLKRVSLGYFSKNSTGEILADLTSEFTQLEINGMSMINNVMNGYINFIAIALSLCIFNPLAALIATAGVLVSSLALRGINHQSKKTAPINQKAGEMLASAVLEYVRGIPVVKAFGQEGPAFESLQNTFYESKNINIAIEKSYIPWNVLHLFALRLSSVTIVLISAQYMMNGSITLPLMLLMAMFSFSMFASIEVINDSAHVLGMIGTAMDKIEKLEQADFIDQDGIDLKLDSFDIKFDDVSFCYDKKDVIRNVSFTVKQNATTAIVGPSGSGKTTLCSLMTRFYDVQKGHILVGGHDIKEFTCDSLLKNFSIVFQNVYLFRDTIRNNIRFGKPDATEDELIAAAKAAMCHEFIMALPAGYDTMVGEGGSSLSGGEKQRISIARAILKDAPIIILDEATASIDPENEHLIQQALSALTYGKTIIAIAHRLATIEQANQILVMDEGKIVQHGTHEELMAQDGIYRDFVSIRQRAEGWSIA